MTKLVTQKTGSDCVLAAIAMAVGKSYDEAWTAEDTDAVTECRGINDYTPWMARQGLQEYVDYKQVWTHDNATLSAMLWGRRAILAVASLNIDGGWHAVYWDGERLYDPSNKNTFTYLHTCRVYRVVLLRGAQP